MERRLDEELLVGLAATVAGDVAGRDGDEVGSDAVLVHHVEDAVGAEEVDLDRGVERVVERHGGSGVHDDVGARPDGAVLFGQTEAVGADISGDDGDALVAVGVELVAELAAQLVERVVLEDLALDATLHRATARRTDEQDESTVGNAAQQPLHERRAEEAGASGDGDAFPCEGLGDHGR